MKIMYKGKAKINARTRHPDLQPHQQKNFVLVPDSKLEVDDATGAYLKRLYPELIATGDEFLNVFADAAKIDLPEPEQVERPTQPNGGIPMPSMAEIEAMLDKRLTAALVASGMTKEEADAHVAQQKQEVAEAAASAEGLAGDQAKPNLLQRVKGEV